MCVKVWVDVVVGEVYFSVGYVGMMSIGFVYDFY